jgi:hypothetical protein
MDVVAIQLDPEAHAEAVADATKARVGGTEQKLAGGAGASDVGVKLHGILDGGSAHEIHIGADDGLGMGGDWQGEAGGRSQCKAKFHESLQSDNEFDGLLSPNINDSNKVQMGGS